VIAGLEAQRADGTISQQQYDAIAEALVIPERASHNTIAIGYRNRLTHHIRPSVDYPMFYSALQSRLGEEVRDAQGKLIGRRHAVLARDPVQYEYETLFIAISSYLDAVVDMLDRLSHVDLLR
jgi:hypothetical protein